MIRFLTIVVLVCLGLVAAPMLLQGKGALSAELPLDGEMRKLSLSAERKPVAAAEFHDENGKAITLAAFRGKVVLLNIWATWCVPCREEMPALDRLQARRGGPDFQVVAVSQDRGGRAKVDKFFDEIGVKALRPYIDASMKSARAWGAAGLPASILLDRQGREVARLYGAAQWDGPEALKLIDALVAEK